MKRSYRNDARDRSLLSISEALIRLLGDRLVGESLENEKVRRQIVHNLTECNRDLLTASGLEHGRPSGWRDQINTIA